MIDLDDGLDLEALLALDADGYDVPPDGPTLVLAAARPTPLDGAAPARGGRFRSLPPLAKVALIVVVLGAVAALAGTAPGRPGPAEDRAAPSSGAAPQDAGVSKYAGADAPPTTAGGATLGDLGTRAPNAQVGPAVASEKAGRTAPDEGSGADGSTAPAADGAPQPKVVRTGSIELQVPKGRFGTAVQRLTTLADGSGGSVASSKTDELDGQPRGTITLRVPADRFDRLVAEVRAIGTVQSATTDSQEVTGEYTDLQSRLKAATAERDQIDTILAQAKTIPEILSVRDRRNQVQTEIETIQGRLKLLDDQTSLSTLTVAVHEQGDAVVAPPVPKPRSGLAQAWHDATHRFAHGVEAIIAGSGTVALLALCAAVLWLVGRPLWRRYRRAAL